MGTIPPRPSKGDIIGVMNHMRRVIGFAVILLAAIGCLWWKWGPLPLRLALWKFIQDENIPGVAIAVYREGGIGLTLELGALRDSKTPITENTRFTIASLSKPLTAAAVRKLVKNGQLKLSSKVTEALPELSFQMQQDGYGAPTIQQLLQHTAGLRGAGIGDFMFDSHGVVGCEGAIAAQLRQPLLPAGQQTIYSNIGYCLLGKIIARRTGMIYPQAVRKLLQLDTRHDGLTFGPPMQTQGNLHSSFGAEQHVLLGAAGGWFSDASTLAAVLGEDAANEFDRIRLDLASTVKVKSEPSYGLGWRIWPRQPDTLAHFGLLPNTYALAVTVRKKGTAVALFTGSPADAENATQILVPILAGAL